MVVSILLPDEKIKFCHPVLLSVTVLWFGLAWFQFHLGVFLVAWFLSLSCLCDLENLGLVGSHKDKCPSHAYAVKELMTFSIGRSVQVVQVLKPLKSPRLV